MKMESVHTQFNSAAITFISFANFKFKILTYKTGCCSSSIFESFNYLLFHFLILLSIDCKNKIPAIRPRFPVPTWAAERADGC